MKKILQLSFLAALFLSPAVSHARPRFPFPETKDKVWQNDVDLHDEIIAGDYEVAFLAKFVALATNVTGDGTSYTVAYDSETYDLHDNFSTSTHLFTAPVKGIYACSASVLTDQNTAGGGFGAGGVSMFINGGGVEHYDVEWTNASGIGGVNSERVPYQISIPSLYLNPGDTVNIALGVAGGAKTIDIIQTDRNWFGCALVHRID